MMQSTAGFSGLTMPVFTAFGWAGEEAAIKFALSQLSEFIYSLHANLPRSIQKNLPAYGLNEVNQSVYLAVSSEVESDVYIAFNTRPMSFEIQLVLEGKEALTRSLKFAEKDLVRCHRLITELGPDWTIHVQQKEFNEESGEATQYQDLFKDSVAKFSEELVVAVMSKAAYLNGDSQWVTPIAISRRITSDQASNMGSSIIRVMSELVTGLTPLVLFLTGQTGKKTPKKPKIKPKIEVEAAPQPVEVIEVDSDEGFTYIAELKPLHLRRGFINLTPEHWPFFGVNSRSTTRDVTIYYDGIYDKKNIVWRLVPHDQARIVLSPTVHSWLEDYFDTNDRIQVVARKLGEEEIQISLQAVG